MINNIINLTTSRRDYIKLQQGSATLPYCRFTVMYFTIHQQKQMGCNAERSHLALWFSIQVTEDYLQYYFLLYIY